MAKKVKTTVKKTFYALDESMSPFGELYPKESLKVAYDDIEKQFKNDDWYVYKIELVGKLKQNLEIVKI